MCPHFLKEAQAVQADPKEVQADKVLEVARAVSKVLEAVKVAREVAKDVREQAAVIATDSASKLSATRPKITCCSAFANPIPVSTSLPREVPAVPAVQEALVVTEDSEVVITTVLAQAVQAVPAALEAADSKEANNSFSKLARITKPTPIKPRPVCPTPSRSHKPKTKLK